MSDPFGGASGAGGFDPRMFSQIPLFRELNRVMSWSGGPVNWDLARQAASSVLASEGRGARALPATHGGDDPLVQAVQTAELWLDSVTDLPAVSGPVQTFDPAGWAHAATTPEGLGVYLEPTADGMGQALGKGLGAGMPEQLQGLLGGAGGPDMIGQMLRPMSAMMYGLQGGQIAGHLATQLLSTYDLGVPTLDPRTVGVLGGQAERLAREQGLDRTELLHWLALREAAHRRQFAGVGWLRPHLRELLRRFAAAADFDPASLMQRLGGLGLDPSALGDPEKLREALTDADAFTIEPTAEQRGVLRSLQALAAFTRAWVDVVVRTAASGRLPSAARIEEVMKRRRAERGRGEEFLQQLVGLDLRPEDLQLGRSFCAAVLDARGQGGLDHVWRDAAWLPDYDELVEPSRWLLRLAADETAVGTDDDLPELDLELPDDLSGLDDTS